MNNEELKSRITGLLATAAVEEGGQWLTINVEPGEWRFLAERLRNDPSLCFDYLFCLTCIDWKTHLTMVYH
jgi:NADH-quinone oxidoreductase subunit C